MSKLKEISEGHLNEFLSKVGVSQSDEKEKVFAARKKICLNCPLKSGNNCNPRKSINPSTLEVKDIPLGKAPEKGFIKGCGCRLSAKQRSPGSKCPAGFWGGEFNLKTK